MPHGPTSDPRGRPALLMKYLRIAGLRTQGWEKNSSNEDGGGWSGVLMANIDEESWFQVSRRIGRAWRMRMTTATLARFLHPDGARQMWVGMESRWFNLHSEDPPKGIGGCSHQETMGGL